MARITNFFAVFLVMCASRLLGAMPGVRATEAKNTLRWNPQQQGIGADGRIHFVIPITTPDANKDEIRICGMLYL